MNKLPTPWTKDQLREIYFRLISYKFLNSETKPRPEDFLSLFYNADNQNEIHFEFEGTQDKMPIILCIILRIVGWNTVNEIPWTDIEESFHVSNSTYTLKSVFDTLLNVPRFHVFERKDMSVYWNDWMKFADFIFERLDLLSSQINNRGYLSATEDCLPILVTKFNEDQLRQIYYWCNERMLIDSGPSAMYDFVHMFNVPLRKNEHFERFNWCGTLKQLSLFIKMILKPLQPGKKDWDTVAHCFSCKMKDISPDSIRTEHNKGTKNKFGDTDTSSIDYVFSKIK